MADDMAPVIDEEAQNIVLDPDAAEAPEAPAVEKHSLFVRDAERAKVTQKAQQDAKEALAYVDVAIESDSAADEAMRATSAAERSGDREAIKEARAKERAARKKARADHRQASKSAKDAYNAIKFSDRNSMGMLRFVQVIFGIHIASVLILLILTSRDVVVYNFDNVMDWIMVVLEGIAFFFIINRYKVARPFVIAMSIFGLIVPAISDMLAGHFNLVLTLINGAFYLFLLFYFIFSSRVKTTMVNDIRTRKGEFEPENVKLNRRGWPFIRNLIILFLVFSTLGHFMEIGMCQFIIMGLVEGEVDTTNTMLYRDLMFPFPMEGAVVVFIALFLYPFYTWLKKKMKPKFLAYVVSFITSALLCSAIEFSMGLIFNADLQNWDYSNQFGNIMGQVCLQNTLAFGAAASIVTWWVYPLIERFFARIPNDIMNVAFVVIFMINTIIWSLYIIVPPWISNENRSPEELAQLAQQQDVEALEQERTSLAQSIEAIGASNEFLTDMVRTNQGITEAERENILSELDIIFSHVDAIGEELGGGLPEELIPPLSSAESASG